MFAFLKNPSFFSTKGTSRVSRKGISSFLRFSIWCFWFIYVYYSYHYCINGIILNYIWSSKKYNLVMCKEDNYKNQIMNMFLHDMANKYHPKLHNFKNYIYIACSTNNIISIPCTNYLPHIFNSIFFLIYCKKGH